MIKVMKYNWGSRALPCGMAFHINFHPENFFELSTQSNLPDKTTEKALRTVI